LHVWVARVARRAPEFAHGPTTFEDLGQKSVERRRSRATFRASHKEQLRTCTNTSPLPLSNEVNIGWRVCVRLNKPMARGDGIAQVGRGGAKTAFCGGGTGPRRPDAVSKCFAQGCPGASRKCQAKPVTAAVVAAVEVEASAFPPPPRPWRPRRRRDLLAPPPGAPAAASAEGTRST